MKTLNQVDTIAPVQERVISLIKQNGMSGTSYAELHHLEGFVATKEGDLGGNVTFLDNPNLIQWMDVSPEGHEVLQSLKTDDPFGLKLCSPSLYLLEGISLNLPVASHFPVKTDYATRHWVPAMWIFDEQGVD